VNARAQEIAEELLGTCKDMADAANEPGEMDDVALISDVEALVYQCDVCGWWVERDEVDEDGACTDCACDA
jgi:hypothetical protein